MLRKNLILIVLALICTYSASAQNHWANMGSPWRYDLANNHNVASASLISSAYNANDGPYTYVIEYDTIYKSQDQGVTWNFTRWDVKAEVIKAAPGCS
jgi:hypothetical protein